MLKVVLLLNLNQPLFLNESILFFYYIISSTLFEIPNKKKYKSIHAKRMKKI